MQCSRLLIPFLLKNSFLSRPSHTDSDIIDITTTSRETARYYYFVCVSGSRVFGKIQARAHMTQISAGEFACTLQSTVKTNSCHNKSRNQNTHT